MMKTLDRKKIPVLVFVVTFIIMVIGELLSKSVNAILLILAGGIIGIFCTSFKGSERRMQTNDISDIVY